MSDRAGKPAPGRAAEVRPAVGRWVCVRIYLTTFVLTALFVGIGYRAYGVQIERGDHYRDLARRQHLSSVEVPAPRGVIHDRTGFELAVTADAESVYASPREVVDVVGTAEQLAEFLDIDVRVAEAKLSSRRYFVWLKRHVQESESASIRRANLPGIAITTEPRRFYPARDLGGTVIGFAGIDGQGLDGIELSMDELLAGQRAKLRALRDASGARMLGARADGEGAAARPGASVTLTLDRFIQFTCERALGEALAEHGAKAGTAVVLDIHTGAVLAMASLPSYDPNRPADRVKSGARNRAITDAYEVGSVMKVFTVAAALDDGAVRPAEVIDVEHGRMKVGRKTIRDTHRDRELTAGGIIKRSSNVGAVKIAQRLGKERLHAALRKLGFGEETGIELGGERAGLVYPPSRWGDLHLATISFGYGLMVTPIQLAAALAAVGNGGTLYAPRLVARVTDADGAVLYEHSPVGKRVFAPATSRALLPMLASVFERGKDGGTARSVDLDGFTAGGKTGTSHKLDPETRRYDRSRYLASFMGVAPATDPRLAVVVMIDEPSGEHHYGGRVAGPVFARIISESLRYLGVPADGSRAPIDPAGCASAGSADDDCATESLEIAETAESDSAIPLTGGTGLYADELREIDAGEETEVPSFIGLGLGRALDLARQARVDVTIEGTGIAVDQDPMPGTPVSSSPCRITFAPDPSRAGSPEPWPRTDDGSPTGATNRVE